MQLQFHYKYENINLLYSLDCENNFIGISIAHLNEIMCKQKKLGQIYESNGIETYIDQICSPIYVETQDRIYKGGE